MSASRRATATHDELDVSVLAVIVVIVAVLGGFALVAVGFWVS